jgi:hypothetical protein
MKVTPQEYEKFKQYVDAGIERHSQRNPEKFSRAYVKSWLEGINGERLTQHNALTAIRIAMKDCEEAQFWVHCLQYEDSHWATAGRKYFKEFTV